ncbi:hypothetical protein AB0C04_00550 [Micromonospora sp. NPDC048909]|uniref:hypothetical protein n=1 Tax=Micromonospora sp. NPDC048909 TaxID=3155643 RepID=UPI0033D3E572
MSRELPIPRQDDRSDGTAVVEWGSTEPAPAARRGRFLADLGRDRRLPPLLAGLGAVAAVASLIGEWSVMTLPNAGPRGESVRVPAGVSDVAGFGVAYLVGLLALACAVAVVLWGTPAVRANTRLAGLALAGALLALLTASAFTLDKAGQRTFFYGVEDGFQVEYGRGLVMAFVACALLGGALWLGPNLGPFDSDASAQPVFRRRRRPAGDLRDDGPAEPADLTVQPAVPFARPESSH